MKKIKNFCFIIAFAMLCSSCSNDSATEQEEQPKTLEQLDAEFSGSNSIEYFDIISGEQSGKPSGKSSGKQKTKTVASSLKSISGPLSYFNTRAAFGMKPKVFKNILVFQSTLVTSQEVQVQLVTNIIKKVNLKKDEII